MVTITKDFALSQSERCVLARGLKFTLTPPSFDEDEILHDMETIYYRVCLYAYLINPNKSIRVSPPDDLFDKYQHHKSRWTSPMAFDVSVDRCQEEVSNIQLQSSQATQPCQGGETSLMSQKARWYCHQTCWQGWCCGGLEETPLHFGDWEAVAGPSFYKLWNRSYLILDVIMYLLHKIQRIFSWLSGDVCMFLPHWTYFCFHDD